MATRRRRRKQAEEDIDPLGGFSIEQLFGLDPVSEVEKKTNPIVKLVGLPFKLVAGVITLPFKILAAPFRRKSKGEPESES